MTMTLTASVTATSTVESPTGNSLDNHSINQNHFYFKSYHLNALTFFIFLNFYLPIKEVLYVM